MSVARNVWRPAQVSHLVIATAVDSNTVDLLIKSCPAGLFSRTSAGELHVDFRGCLECGTCRLLCDEKTLQGWHYPASGFGITYRFG